GYVAFGPLAASAGSIVPSVDSAGILLTKTVRAIQALHGTVYVGGDFTSAGDGDASNILAWDGAASSKLANGVDGVVYTLAEDGAASSKLANGVDGVVYTLAEDGAASSKLANGVDGVVYTLAEDGAASSKLANGVDGVVYTLAEFQGKLVVGGAFTRAFQTWGSLRCGGLVAWTGKTWEKLSEHIVDGVVHATASNATALFIGGAFSKIGSLAAHGVAMLDNNTGEWVALGDVSGGTVNTLVAQ
ncbi:hypothetical protein T484DRAFT_1769272, partial [Baffinella frigidus]